MQWPKKLQVYHSLALSRILPMLLLIVINWSPISRLNQSTSKSRPHPSQYLNKSQHSLTLFRPAVTWVSSLAFLVHHLISEWNTDSKLIKVLSKVNSLENENRVILLLTLVTKKKFSPHDSTTQFYVLQSHSVASSAEHADILYKIFLIFAMIKMIICKIKIITIIKKKKNVYYKIIILLYCLI